MTESLDEKLENYFTKAKPLFEGLKVSEPESTDWRKLGKEFLEMTLGYYEDALHFAEKGEAVNALAALEYAEGWMDAGKRIGLFR